MISSVICTLIHYTSVDIVEQSSTFLISRDSFFYLYFDPTKCSWTDFERYLYFDPLISSRICADLDTSVEIVERSRHFLLVLWSTECSWTDFEQILRRLLQWIIVEQSTFFRFRAIHFFNTLIHWSGSWTIWWIILVERSTNCFVPLLTDVLYESVQRDS